MLEALSTFLVGVLFHPVETPKKICSAINHPEMFCVFHSSSKGPKRKYNKTRCEISIISNVPPPVGSQVILSDPGVYVHKNSISIVCNNIGIRARQ